MRELFVTHWDHEEFQLEDVLISIGNLLFAWSLVLSWPLQRGYCDQRQVPLRVELQVTFAEFI